MVRGAGRKIQWGSCPPTSRAYMLAGLYDQNRNGFLEGWLLSSQSEQSEKFSKSLDWLEKSRPSKKSHFCFNRVNRLLACLHDNRLLACLYDQNKSGFFGGPAFFQPFRAF